MARNDFYASPFGATYSAYMERPRLSRLIGRLAWGGDPKPYYESMGAVGALGDGATVIDCPCGAGPALRALPADASVRYVAADRSPSMLRRARKRAQARGLSGIEFVEADATDLPLEDASADLFLSYWGLHCFEDPPAALKEAARVVKPGRRLVGSSFVSGSASRRQRLLIRPAPATSARSAPRSRSKPGSVRLASISPAPAAPARCCSSRHGSRHIDLQFPAAASLLSAFRGGSSCRVTCGPCTEG